MVPGLCFFDDGARLDRSALTAAFALALGAAISLGLARFSYALMLPPMRADLAWSYLTAGAMNTVNAAGYLAGALYTARALRRHAARRVLLAGGIGSSVALFAHGAFAADLPLYACRFATGFASAATLVAGGLLAARLVARPPSAGAKPLHSGLVLGIYYGGTGWGILVSALVVPALLIASFAHPWQPAWAGLGLVSLVATGVMAVGTRGLEVAAAASAPSHAAGFRMRAFGYGLVAYFLFGVGYIGYMTFIVTLLSEMRLPSALITVFYVVLGLAVCLSTWLWAGLLHRHRGGGAMSILAALLAIATVLPVLSAHPLAVWVSGLLFGGVFLSLVASTTALVRHNLPEASLPAGIGVFTVVFAAGQIVGPTLIGWLADGAGGLRGGLACSAAVLAAASVVARRQRPLA
jgi:predicted MFS family arabinose efflux permease